MRKLQVLEIGRTGYSEAFELQRELVEKRKKGLIPDQLLLLEHPHVITMGRNGQMRNLLASNELLERAGIEFHQTDRGGDITYHGPGQIVGYPILDLREWKRDVVEYVRQVEQVLIDALGDIGIVAGRSEGHTGVWVEGKGKVAAIGIHISRWITSHGFALNFDTDLSYFQYIVPCGLTKPVTSVRDLGFRGARAEMADAIVQHFAAGFGYTEVERRRSPESELTEMEPAAR